LDVLELDQGDHHAALLAVDQVGGLEGYLVRTGCE
jgi:hypothetical protein